MLELFWADANQCAFVFAPSDIDIDIDQRKACMHGIDVMPNASEGYDQSRGLEGLQA